MNLPPWISLSGRITLILLAAGGAFLVMLIVGSQQYRQMLLDNAIQGIEAEVRAEADDFGQLLEKGRGVLDTLLAVAAVRNGGQDCGRVLADVAADSRIHHLIRFDAQGQAVCGSSPGAAEMRVADTPVFQAARNADGLVISEPLTSGVDGRSVIMLARAVVEDAQFAGMIAATFTVETAHEVITTQQLSFDATITIVNGEGEQLVGHADDAADSTAANALSGPLMDSIRNVQSGSVRFTAPGGRRIAGVAQVSHFGEAYAVITVPEESLLAPAKRLMWAAFGVATGIMVLALGAVYVILHAHVVRPIRELIATTDDLAAGDYRTVRTKPRTNRGELSQLHNQLEVLADALESREHQLDAARAHRQAVIDSLPQAVCVVAPDHTIIAANPAVTEDLNVPPRVLEPGTDIAAFVRYSAERGDYGDIDVATVIDQWREAIREGRSLSFEKGHPEGRTFAVEGRPLPDGGYLKSYAEITERKRLAETLAELFDNAARRDLPSEQRINMLLEIGRRHFGMPVGWVAGIDGDRYTIEYAANEVGTGLPVGSVIPFSETYCSYAIQENDVVAFEYASQQGLANAPCYRRFAIESYIGMPLSVSGAGTGALCFHSITPALHAFSESDRQVLHLLAQWIDVELQREHNLANLHRTQARLAAEQARLAAVIDATRDGIAPIDAQNQVVSANRVMGDIFGTDPEQLVGSELALLFAPADRDTVMSGLADFRDDDGERDGLQLKLNGLRADGTRFPAELYFARMAVSGEDLILAVITDVSEAQKAETIKSQFVSTVSHELRTPLTSIVGSLGLVQGGAAGELPPRAAALIDTAHRNADRLISLVNDILDFERLGSGRIEIQPQEVDLEAQLVAAREHNAGYAEQAGCRLEVDGPTTPKTVRVDPERLQQVFSNLISNAAKFSPDGEVVSVWAEEDEDGGSVIVTVRDRGPGLDETVRERLFQPFVQVDPADNRKHQKGTGLGLAITHSLLERMGGAITVDSQPGDTRFVIRLPIANMGE